MAGKPSTFTGSPEVFRIADEKQGKDVTLEPFYKMHGKRHYVVYWDRFTPEQWQAKEAEYQAQIEPAEAAGSPHHRLVNPGEEQNERDHKLQGENTDSGDFNERKWRHATDGGWFSWELKVLPDQAQELRVTYWGSDGGNRIFDILIDGT